MFFFSFLRFRKEDTDCPGVNFKQRERTFSYKKVEAERAKLFWLKHTQNEVVILLYYRINNDPLPKNSWISSRGRRTRVSAPLRPWVSEFSPCPVCGNTSACSLPWNAALVEELASAGEELLERELKGDCLKHSSRNGLEGDAWRQQLHRQLVTLTHSLTRCKHSCWLCVTPSPGTQYHKV